MNCSNKTVKNKVFFAGLVLQFIVILACITGALLAKRGNRGILREARNEGRRKKYFCEIFFFFPRFAIRARLALCGKYRVRLARLIKRLLYRLLQSIFFSFFENSSNCVTP